MEQSINEKRVVNLLNNLSFKSDFTNEDLAYVESDNSRTFKTYLDECFNNVSTIFKTSGVYNQYIVLKIYKYIDLEHNYSLLGYNNTANVELANFDVTSEIKNELEPIEKLLIKNPNLVCSYSVNLNNKNEKYFTLKSENQEAISILKNYDLDINPFVESEI